MRLADAPDHDAADGPSITLSAALLRGDERLVALFAPFRECVLLSETLMHDGSTARASRLLMAEIKADRLDEIRALVREVCAKGSFEEKPTELDDVAGGTEWQERGGTLAIAAYRLFGGSTALHVTSGKIDPPDAGLQALLESPLAIIEGLVASTSFVEHVSCSRSASDVPRWHLGATLRDLRRFEEIVPQIIALGFEERKGKYWHDTVIAQAVGKKGWMAAQPGIDFAP